MKNIVVILAAVALGVFLHKHFSQKKAEIWMEPRSADHSTRPENLLPERDDDATSSSMSSRYRCDGRTRCPQMSSCDEAVWFLEHCPGMEMDGDGDGIPCEDQHCSHLR